MLHVNLMKHLALLLSAALLSPSTLHAVGKHSKPDGLAWSPEHFVYQKVKKQRGGVWGFVPSEFYHHYLKATANLKKGEYETTEQFMIRMENAESAVAPFNSISEYVFTFENTNYTYDADRGAFEPASPDNTKCTPTPELRGWYSCEVGRISRKSIDRLATNAFGAIREVRETKGSDLTLIVSGDSPLIMSFFKSSNCIMCRPSSYYLTHALPMSADRAKKIGKYNIRVAITGQIVSHGLQQLSPLSLRSTFDNPGSVYVTKHGVKFEPNRLIFYSNVTGEIFDELNVSSPKNPTETPPVN